MDAERQSKDIIAFLRGVTPAQWSQCDLLRTEWECPNYCHCCGDVDTHLICRCHAVKYCSVGCRDENWTAHRTECGMYIEKKLRKNQGGAESRHGDACEIVLLGVMLRIKQHQQDYAALWGYAEELISVTKRAVRTLERDGCPQSSITLMYLLGAQASRYLAYLAFM
jgi:hypothetical protein